MKNIYVAKALLTDHIYTNGGGGGLDTCKDKNERQTACSRDSLASNLNSNREVCGDRKLLFGTVNDGLDKRSREVDGESSSR